MLPRTPLQGGRGPGFGGRGPMMGMNRMPRNPMMNPMMRGPGQMGQSGGLLSKIFGNANPGAAGSMGRLGGLAGTPGAGSGGSILKALSNPGGLSGILNNTQQVLKTAQTVGPMLQQYGPLVRNLPAMWKLFRGLKNATGDTEDTNENTETSKEEEVESHSESESKSESGEKKQPKITKETSSKKKSHTTNRKKTSVKEKGASIPRMYI